MRASSKLALCLSTRAMAVATGFKQAFAAEASVKLTVAAQR